MESFTEPHRWSVWLADFEMDKEMRFSYMQEEEGYIGFAWREGRLPENLSGITHPGETMMDAHLQPGLTMRAVGVYLFDGFFEHYPGADTGYMDFIRAIQDHDESVIIKHLNPVLLQMLNGRQEGLAKRLFLESRVLEIAAKLLEILNRERGENGKRLVLRAYDKEQLAQVPKLLAENLVRPPGITELARRTALNEQKLKAGFRQQYGMTIYEYLRRLRMERAVELLKQEEITVREVSERVGYNTLHGFAQTFAKQYGKTPAEWRRKGG